MPLIGVYSTKLTIPEFWRIIMKLLYTSGGLLAAGLYFFARNIVHLRNENKLREYLEKSGKARLWIKFFGLEKTVRLTKFVFIPLGMVVSVAFIVIGTRGLFIHFGLME